MKSTRLLLTLLSAATLAVAMTVAEDRDLESFREAADCADCHVFIAAEWAGSAHGNAGTAGLDTLKLLPAETRDRLRPYYVPTAVLAAAEPGPPEVRSVFAERGVDCIACHLDAEYRMHGSAGLAAPHQVVADEELQTVEACVPCHGQGDELDQVSAWEESGLEQGQVYCQSCHMPDARRQLVQHWALEDLPERASHDHFFRAATDADFLKTAVTMEAVPEEQEVVVTLRVGVIGHHFPGIAFRQLSLVIRGLDGAGEALWSEEELIDGLEHDNRLRTGETRRYRYPSREAASVEAVLTYRRAPGLEEGSIEVARAG